MTARRRDPSHMPPAPTEASLHEAALNHLARFAATEAGLRRVLENRVRRWVLRATRGGMAEEQAAAVADPARAAASRIASRLVAAGAVNDATFAEARARRLLRAGRSTRGALAQLAQKGVAGDVARAALAAEGVPDESLAALAFCRRRRIGPFASDATPESRLKWLGSLARAGFGRGVAEAALNTPRAEAEAHLARAAP